MNIYHKNIEEFKEKSLELAKAIKRLSSFRLLAFILSVSLIVILAKQGLIFFIWIAIPLCVIGFVFLIQRYNKLNYQKQHATFLKEINEHEILRQKNKLAGFPTGQTFIRRDHPYVADLDIFGEHSLYQLINRTTTESGSVKLADWLSESASQDVILQRKQAVQELSPLLEWRQDFQASGMHFGNSRSDYNKLLSWIEKPVQLLPNKIKYLIACLVLGILSSAALYHHFLYAYTSGYIIHTLPLLIILLVNYFVLKSVRAVAEETIDSTHHNTKVLGGYHSLVLKIESTQFYSPILQQLQSVFSQGNYSAAKEINKLQKILEIFQLRGTRKQMVGGNLFYAVLNNFWLLDIYWIILSEKWKVKNSSYLKSWAAAVSEFEAFNSIAGFSYSNPSYTFPEIKEGACTLQFEMLDHPLISPESRICNSFNFKAREKIAMITGSNMAGKSTFLRTVGINVVLALMGAPCCARSGLVSNMKLFSSMRTQDNLEEGVSSFYAELKKIEQLLNLIESGEPIFFLLDEMFKGTNSKDRHRGGFSLIKQLEELNAFGIISTHDLDLAALAGKHTLVTNYSFNSKIREGEMFFNYELTPGLCRDFNASELMKKSGIKILSHIEE